MTPEDRIRIYHVLRQAIAKLERLRDDVIGGDFDGAVDYNLSGGQVEVFWVDDGEGV